MIHPAIHKYVADRQASEIDPQFLAYLANLSCVSDASPHAARAIVNELRDQRGNLKLIASENYCSIAVQSAMANLLTDKYAEGFPFKRFYAGCDNIDDLEDHARGLACELFGAEHAYVQPHSGADANLVAFWAILSARVEAPLLGELEEKNPQNLSHEDWERIRQRLGNQRMLGMDLNSGGHLTHGYRLNVSAKMFDAYTYAVAPETELLDYDAIAAQAREVRPLILLAGYSAYPRRIDFSRMREIADDVGAVLMVDMAHFAGLVAGGVLQGVHNPIPYAHVVTSTTHKTLRGPRGGLVLATGEFADHIDRGCPLVLGGPLPHMIAAKAVAFGEALTPEFSAYAARVVDNAQALAEAAQASGMRPVSGGTENHLVLVDVRPFGVTGRQSETAVRECGITLNRNAIPFDTNGAWYTSGLRLGTAAVTTTGMGRDEMREIAAVMELILSNTSATTTRSGKKSLAKYTLEPAAKAEAESRVSEMLESFPVYPGLDLELLQSCFCDSDATVA